MMDVGATLPFFFSNPENIRIPYIFLSLNRAQHIFLGNEPHRLLSSAYLCFISTSDI